MDPLQVLVTAIAALPWGNSAGLITAPDLQALFNNIVAALEAIVDPATVLEACDVVTSGATAGAPHSAAGNQTLFIKTGEPAYIQLPPSPVAGMWQTVKDSLGVAATQNITVVPYGAALIDGSETYVLTENWQAQTLRFDGVSWGVFG